MGIIKRKIWYWVRICWKMSFSVWYHRPLIGPYLFPYWSLYPYVSLSLHGLPGPDTGIVWFQCDPYVVLTWFLHDPDIVSTTYRSAWSPSGHSWSFSVPHMVSLVLSCPLSHFYCFSVVPILVLLLPMLSLLYLICSCSTGRQHVYSKGAIHTI